jgi:hypothetical protein
MKSKFLTLDARDILHGILMAFLTALLTGIIDMLQRRHTVHDARQTVYGPELRTQGAG